MTERRVPKKRKSSDSDVTTAMSKSPHPEQAVKAAAPDLSLANRLKSPTPHHPTTTAAPDLSLANRPKDEKEGEKQG